MTGVSHATGGRQHLVARQSASWKASCREGGAVSTMKSVGILRFVMLGTLMYAWSA
jgi:hypothetical protein